VTIVEITDKQRIAELLSADPIANLEPLDESHHGVEGLVTVFAEEVEHPKNLLAVRWGQKNLGLGSIAHLIATRLSELGELIDAFPADRGRFELRFPFWASPAISSSLKTEELSMTARYLVDKRSLAKLPIARKAVRVDDLSIVKPIFPKLADDSPAYVMSLGDQLVSVAAVTHLLQDVANVHVYTTEQARGRGFGRGALLALSEELLALSIRPTVTVDLGHEPAVRMVEGAGFFQHAVFLRTNVVGRFEGGEGDGLVTLGRS
jgi:hypothetical protein